MPENETVETLEEIVEPSTGSECTCLVVLGVCALVGAVGFGVKKLYDKFKTRKDEGDATQVEVEDDDTQDETDNVEDKTE